MVSGRMFSALVGDKLHRATKELLLNSPMFVRFAQESSAAAKDAMKEVARRAEANGIQGNQASEAVWKVGRTALRDVERRAKRAATKR
mmetsp:Transcript_23455/g.35410  ORF Transcript_23455/g.35410 Transcript_23455/m.35410 type:complete len:88 (-) Transcript_23455:435-698(-)|eukprot:CAMPEP_0194748834 /NCGR_PEP_ID=MMETSP0323_2-20130528/3013_1 /TAXON_ID=2866 ORGANISM="Crypthecodinium cohnii, Strain Seligo" /NCGR_SAMPLE_ID=MMETSP0323_2 /ASSEMBLY_ACC=CAM_ASM_000346 /LENGTH=87 /DNA_ID=CAMNT_0039663449 /DNA_START=106 /DNA_END=369 /DNA_ORIENTATION=-